MDEPQFLTLREMPHSGMTRRRVLAGGAILALGACTQTLMEARVAQSVTIRRIVILTNSITQYSVREMAVTRARFAADLERHIRAELGNRVQPDGNAELIVVVKRIWLKSPGQSFLIGGPSFIDADVTVRRIADGLIIAGPTSFSAVSHHRRWGGIIGAMGAPSAQDDYLQTLRGFAVRINEALFEGGTTTY